MSAARAAMEPPELPGYRPVRLLGSGGYSDVFLYEQAMPKRNVAIKVLVARGLGDAGQQQFSDEANAMAAVSTHPYIVTVFDAQVSAGGHPYLVMEFYPRPNFSVRARNERIPVVEVLRVGIQVASAVETAHRAGILHRDIKPANILASEYNYPGLTDFGIATSATEGSAAEGLSIPWSPPEILNASASGDETADVYSLSATIYTLLAGRSPFEIPGESNRSIDLMQRIGRGDPPPTGREDVPDGLERILRHGMRLVPADRPPSALELGRMLQSVELELNLPPTAFEIRSDVSDAWERHEEPGVDGTRLKNPVVIRSQEPTGPLVTGPLVTGPLVTGPPVTGPPVMGPPVTGAPVADSTVARGGDVESTVHRDSTMHRSAAGATTGDMIAGVGSRPIGAPDWGAMPATAGVPGVPGVAGVHDVAAAPVEVAAPAEPSRRAMPATATIVKAAWVVLALVVAVVVVKLVVGSTSSGKDDTETSTTAPPTLPNGGVDVPTSPTSVTVTPSAGGFTVTWEHPDQDPTKFTYSVLDATSDKVLAQVADGTKGVTLTSVPPCVRVVASRTADGKSSDARDAHNTNCPG